MFTTKFCDFLRASRAILGRKAKAKPVGHYTNVLLKQKTKKICIIDYFVVLYCTKAKGDCE